MRALTHLIVDTHYHLVASGNLQRIKYVKRGENRREENRAEKRWGEKRRGEN